MSGQTLQSERMVQWADSDPAGRINSPRAFDFAAEAIEGFFRSQLGISYLQLIRNHNLGAPFVHASCDYLSSLLEGESVRLTLSIERLGTSSITWRVAAAHFDDGRPVFDVRMISTIISMNSGRAVPIPKDFRAAMAPYVIDAAVRVMP